MIEASHRCGPWALTLSLSRLEVAKFWGWSGGAVKVSWQRPQLILFCLKLMLVA